LLREDLGELLKFSKGLGLTTILSTNGTRLRKKLDDIAENINFIGLPLDSSDEKVHNTMRPTRTVANHYQEVLGLLDHLPNRYPAIGVKINTLVSGVNMDGVPGIYPIIKGKVISWKLSQFIPGAYGCQHEQKFRISDQDYSGVVSRVKSLNGSVNLIASGAYSCDSGCRVISPNGHLLRPVRAELQDMGEINANLPASAYEGFDSKLNLGILEDTYLKHGK
jgi:MoaA/NifB/PqqE/SkfB family radical SAM enzyme